MRKVADSEKGVFQVRNGIAVQSTKSKTLLALPMMSLITVFMTFCMAEIAIKSFKLFSNVPAGLFSAEIFGKELAEFWIVALIGCICICAANCLKRHSVKATLAVLFAAVVFFVYNYKAVANGFVHALNKATYSVALLNGERLTSYYINPFDSENPHWELKLFCVGVIWLTCFFMAYGVIRRCSVIVPVIIALVYVTPPLMMYAFVGEMYIVLFSVCVMVIFVMKTGGYNGFDYALSGSIFSKQRLIIKGKYVSKAAVQQGLSVLLCSLILLTGISVFYDKDGYERSDTVEQMSKNITSVFEQISSGGVFSVGTASDLNNGNIYQTGNLKYNGDVMFKIKHDNPYNKALYLRSYTAGGYDGKRWYELPRKTYKEYDDIWSELGENNFLTPFIYSYYTIFDNPARREDVFTIVNENIDHRIFLNSPYTDINNTNDSSLINCFYDNTHKISSVAGVESYTQSIYFGNEDDNDVFLYWDSFEGSITDILLSDAFECVSTMSAYGYDEGYYEQYSSFINCESRYRKFVVENYTDYPDIIDEIFPQSLDCEKVLSSLLDRFSTEYISTNPVEDYYSYVVNGVREYLHENAEYTLTPGKAPYGEDFVEYFLNQNHKGYCVHFATAGALMLRKAGIPTRYVEGYYVSGSELQSQYGEEYTNVTDSRAHAWVEVYYPLKGWQVVEFTPSYGEYGEVPDENDDWEDLEESDTASENDTESEITTDSDTQTENDDTDTQSGDSENDTESNTLQADLISDSDNSIANDVFSNSGYASNIITVLCCVVVVVLLWLLARVVYRRILLKSFERNERRKGAEALYKYALRLLNFGGFFVEQNESEQTFAIRVTRQCEFLSDKSFIKFTENALKSRFGREVPSRKNIAEMIKFTDKLSNDIYTNSRRTKKMIMKYFLFLH